MRPQGRKRIGKLLALAGLALLAAWPGLILGLSGLYVFAQTHPPCPPSPAERAGFTTIQLRTGSGIPLRGWWRAPENGSVVILLGGHTASRDAMLPEAEMLAAHGYGVMTVDWRHCAGRPVGLGALELEELEAALRFAGEQPGVERLAVMGFSVGGATALRGAARYPEIAAVIAMGNYDSLLADTVDPDAPVFSLRWQIQHAVLLFLWAQTGVWPGEIRPIDDLRQVRQPVLLIHGEQEAAGNRARAQLAAAAGPKELWIVPDIGHGGYWAAAGAEFEQRVVAFLEASRLPK